MFSVQFKTYQFETDKIRLHLWTHVENFTAFAFETSLQKIVTNIQHFFVRIHFL